MPESSGPGLAQAVADQFSFEQSVGGVRGLIESVVPVTVFTLAFSLTHALVPSAGVAIAISVVLMLARVVARQRVAPALTGLFGVALGAGLAWKTGNAANYFLPSLFKNPAFALVYAVSALVGWPLVGVVLGFMLQEQTAWRQVPARRRAYTQATWLWTAMFALRFVVELPLYLRGDTVGLGIASVPLGLPLYGVVVLLTWLIVRRVPVVKEPAPETESVTAEVESVRPEEPVG